MDNNTENNTPETNEEPKPETTYTDPNAGATYTYGAVPKTEEKETAQSSPDDARTDAVHQQPEQKNAQDNAGYRQPEQGYAQSNTGYSQPGQGYNQPNNGYQNNYNNYNNGYNAYNNNYQNPQSNGLDTTPLSMGEWLLTLLAGIVPCAGIILYFIWAFSRTGNIHRRNFCRAYLILEGIGIVLGILFVIFMMIAGFGSYRYSYYY